MRWLSKNRRNLLRLIRFREDASDRCIFASEDALAGSFSSFQRNAARSDLEWFQHGVDFRLIDKVTYRKATMNLRFLGTLGREVGLEIVQRIDLFRVLLLQLQRAIK